MKKTVLIQFAQDTWAQVRDQLNNAPRKVIAKNK